MTLSDRADILSRLPPPWLVKVRRMRIVWLHRNDTEQSFQDIDQLGVILIVILDIGPDELIATTID